MNLRNQVTKKKLNNFHQHFPRQKVNKIVKERKKELAMELTTKIIVNGLPASGLKLVKMCPNKLSESSTLSPASLTAKLQSKTKS